MRDITNEKLKEILESHKRWIAGFPDGKRADLSEANLSKAYLSGANLSRANLLRADLSKAYLSGANLSGANLLRADLSEAYLSGADLRGANLIKADLWRAYLSGASLKGAYLSGADLRGANLSGANLSGANLNCPMVCPEEGSFIGFKKCRCDLVVKLKITKDSLRSSATDRKCRCSKAIVISITNVDGSETDKTTAYSRFDSNFSYTVGETVEVKNFDTDRWNECAPGIHFFLTRQEAVDY